MKVPSSIKFAKAKKPAISGSSGNKSISGNILPASSNTKTTTSAVACKTVASFPRIDEIIHSKNASFPRKDEPALSIAAVPASCNMDISPSKSDANSVSMDESMSACDSFKSPEVEYIDNNDVPPLDSIERKTFRNLYISDQTERTGTLLVQALFRTWTIEVNSIFWLAVYCLFTFLLQRMYAVEIF